jgi:hypothetical protein
MTYGRRGLILCAAAALGGCATATPYQALMPERGGYSEERLAPHRYRVLFAGNPHTSVERVERHLLRRAAEVTLAQGYSWFRVERRSVEGDVQTIQTRWGPMRVSRGQGASNWRNYGAFYTRGGLKLLKPLWRRVAGGPGEAYEASAEIVLGRGTAPGTEDAFDAHEVLQKLRG